MPKPQWTLYTPVDFDPTKHRSVDQYHGRHELQHQAKYIDQGILIIRFELPYKVRCTGCEQYISMGNRYDAEKRIIGKYHTTSVYKFTMHCHVCLCKWEMRTDPETLDYICLSGCTRKEETWDPRELNGLITTDSEVRKKLLSDKMFTKEYKDDDKRKQFHIDDENTMQEVDNRIKKYDYEINAHMRKKDRQRRAHDKAERKEIDEFTKSHGLEGGDLKILAKSKEDDSSAAELAKRCKTTGGKATSEQVAGMLQDQIGGKRAIKAKTDPFSNFRSPKAKMRFPSAIGTSSVQKMIRPKASAKSPPKVAKVSALASMIRAKSTSGGCVGSASPCQSSSSSSNSSGSIMGALLSRRNSTSATSTPQTTPLRSPQSASKAPALNRSQSAPKGQTTEQSIDLTAVQQHTEPMKPLFVGMGAIQALTNQRKKEAALKKSREKAAKIEARDKRKAGPRIVNKEILKKAEQKLRKRRASGDTIDNLVIELD